MGTKKSTITAQLDRRTQRLFDRIIADLGDEKSCSEAQRQLARRAATLSVVCEQLEPAATMGLEEPLDLYLRATSVLRRVFAALGERRQSVNAVPALSEYLTTKYGPDQGD